MTAIGEIKANQQRLLDEINKIKVHISFLDEACVDILYFTDPNRDSQQSYSHLEAQVWLNLPPL